MRFTPLYLPIVAVALLASNASAATFDQIFVFGDSLSDTGNSTILTGGQFPGANYAPGRYTDGANTTPATFGPQGNWADQLSARLGVADPMPALAGGSNYAVASANTGTSTLYDIGSQVGLYLSTHSTADSSALYAIWGGANDVFSGNSGAQAAKNLLGNIETLALSGAKSFLWLNLPPIDQTPRGAKNPAFKTETMAFNNAWSADLAVLQGLGINVTGVDVNSLFGTIAADKSAYGFQNITDPAQNLSGINPDTYLFWDQQHPTTAGHALVANLAFNDLTATPEPSSYALLGIGLVGVLVMVTRRLSSAK